MLLQEFKKDGLSEPITHSDPPSTTVSPIKPLNCTPLLKDTEHFSSQKRDFNSSSDTYVSDAEPNEETHQDSHMDSFTRNFERNSSADFSNDASVTIPEVTNNDNMHNYTSVQTNMKDTLDEKSPFFEREKDESNSNAGIYSRLSESEALQYEPEKRNTTNINKAEDINVDHAASSSKSIIKNRKAQSPRKSVAFLSGPDLQTFHSYSAAEDDTPKGTPQAPAMVHLWMEVLPSCFDETDAETTQPPIPPPHSTNTVTGLLSMNECQRDEPEISRLTEYCLTQKSFSNLSLDEKIDVFLNNKLHDDLNEHLDILEKAKREETDVNIRRLSYQMSLHEPSSLENPLNALDHSLEYRISAHSSQSSLQSLVESNKYLRSSRIEKQSRGIQLIDGIKGFSDRLATEIIPTTHESAESTQEELAFEPSLRYIAAGDSRDDSNASFSQSQTEKSIMSLLRSVSQFDMTDEFKKNQDQDQEHHTRSQVEGKIEGEVAGQVEDQEVCQEELFSEELETKLEGDREPKLETIEQDLRDTKFIANQELIDPIVKEEPAVPIKENPAISVKEEPDGATVKQEPEETKFRQELEAKMTKQEPRELTKEEPNVKEEPTDSVAQEEYFFPSSKNIGSEDLRKNDSTSDNLPKGNVLGPSVDAITVQVDKSISAGQVKLVGPLVAIDFNEITGETDFADELGDIPSHLDTKHHKTRKREYSSTRLSPTLPLLSTSASSVPSDQVPSDLTASHQVLSTSVTAELPSTDSAAIGLTSSDYDSSVLANSSNIQPQFHIHLPPVELSENEFDDLNKKLTEKSLSYEESLSAEREDEKNLMDFLSIWHSQNLARRPRPATTVVVPSILSYNTDSLWGRFRTSTTSKPKKFTEMNLVSTRVIGLYESLYDSGFLPELSQDLGIEDHFELFLKNACLEQSADDQSSLKRKKNVSSEIFVDSRHPIDIRTGLSSHQNRYTSLKPGNAQDARTGKKNSRFTVPSFKIKRSSSILSPKNMYNDIFQDGYFIEPTIKAPETKSFSSKDRNQIRRIMDIEDAFTRTNGSQIKMVGKTAVAETKTQHHSGQAASLHCDSIVSSEQILSAASSGLLPLETKAAALFSEGLSYDITLSSDRPLVREVITQPVLKSSERVIETGSASVTQRDSFNSNNPFLTRATDLSFPDPDPEPITALQTPVPNFVVSKLRRGVKTEIFETPVTTPYEFRCEPVRSPNAKRNSNGLPIKISSPVKLVKVGGSVTGIVLDKQDRKELCNSTNTQEVSRESSCKKCGHTLSTVSVPTIHTADCLSTAAVEILAMSASSSTQPLAQETEKTENEKRERIVSDGTTEKGKLFLRVVSLKNLILPDLEDRVMSFNITLDNGVHCARTPNYETRGISNVAIGKEFELKVNNSLQFILTLKASYEKPRGTFRQVKERKEVQPRNKFSRIFRSKDVITTTLFVLQEIEDSWQLLFATDGLFARCYVDLEQYLDQVTGVARTINLTCFNEWVTNPKFANKLHAPYPIAQLEVKMLYVPRKEPYEILPLSIKSAYECLDDLRREGLTLLEGYLHQEGGDCVSWKRRWFKLKGTSLIAHSEYSHKTRAKINLTKVVEVVYVDKENINRSSTNYRNFSDILLMEHAFKVRFADGEMIDFGAPNKHEKILWIQAVQEIIYRNKFRRLPWVHLMLDRNEVNGNQTKVK